MRVHILISGKIFNFLVSIVDCHMFFLCYQVELFLLLFYVGFLITVAD